MLYECRLATNEFFQEDADKMGYIMVEHRGRTFWARPMLPFGEFRVPTREWIEKYAKVTQDDCAIGVYCMNVNREAYMVWTGFVIYKDKLPDEAKTNYAYRRYIFTENWTQIIDDKDGHNIYTIKHSDGSHIIIDRTSGSENIEIKDGKFNNKLLMNKDKVELLGEFNNKIVMDKNGVKINGQYVVLKPTLDWIKQNVGNWGTGNLGAPVPLSPSNLSAFNIGLQLFNNFLSKNL